MQIVRSARPARTTPSVRVPAKRERGCRARFVRAVASYSL
ncbi:UNVERIFIED_ORG: hypothetical protein QOE_3810, partial [Clostridioides difficile F501]